MSESHVRLSKVMADRGLCSRREADSLIARGQVMVNGEVISVLGTKIHPLSKIELFAEGQHELDSKVTILFNKPVGIVSSQPEKDYRSALDLISARNQVVVDQRQFQIADRFGLAPAGRLDIDSRGLLVLSQDGALVKKIIGPESRMEKEYWVKISGTLTETKLKDLRFGLKLDGQPLLPAKVDVLENGRLKFILREGRKRQIRRMLDLVDLDVQSLLRVRIGKVFLRDLPEGHWRFLKNSETF